MNHYWIGFQVAALSALALFAALAIGPAQARKIPYR